MSNIKSPGTPGVYIVEKNAFPNSVVEVATAVPAFIGYTEKADNQGLSLLDQPFRISSLSQFHQHFGAAPDPKFTINELDIDDDQDDADFSQADKYYKLKQSSGKFQLYYNMQMFFQNGGGHCYVVSVGKYLDKNDEEVVIDADKMIDGIKLLAKEQEPTLLIIPETVMLSEPDSIKVQQAALQHCGETMRNRFAILDIWEGYKSQKDDSGNCIEKFRSAIGNDHLDYGATYYPWLNTMISKDKDFSFENIETKDVLKKLLSEDPDLLHKESIGSSINAIDKDWTKPDPDTGKVLSDKAIENEKHTLNAILFNNSPLFVKILKIITEQLNLLPPAAAMAGIYTTVDNSRGVWKAPANVSLSSVTSPTVNITAIEQEDLNVTLQGKSINAIREFPEEGTLVWGARTLDGNSLDWRYINVRRTMIMLEESIRLAVKAYVFEPNDANTWVTIKAMITNFLTGIWKQGGLAGAVPEDAFSVHLGLGETMTPVDIQEGILKITVMLAVTRPAEFIEITFQQQMQKT